MSKNITLMGASYSAVPAVTLPQTGGGTATFTDTSDTTATAADVAQGKQFYTAAGVLTAGTASGGGGTSAWTKVAEKSYTTSYTNTSANTIETWATGHSELWTSDKIVYVRIRDTAGKRKGYFYGTDTFFMNMLPKNGSTSTSSSSGTLMEIWSYTTGGQFATRYGYSTTAYGIYADTFYSNGDVRIRERYSSSYSLTINGTYKVEVYMLDPAGGVPIFQ